MAETLPERARREESKRLELAVVGGDGSPAAEAVKLMYETGDYDGLSLSREDEQEAIELLAGMGRLHIFDQMLAGAERLAGAIHSVATRGLQEIVQNAEDQEATEVRFGFRRSRNGGAELLVAHNGKPVELRDVLRMSLPLISGSREDAEKIGQFGVGLKTLKQLGNTLQVHCPPLPSFSIEEGRVLPAATARSIRDYWSADAMETLFVLDLRDKEFDLEFFEDWIAKWDASSLLFLDHVSAVSLVDLGRKSRVVKRCALKRGPDRASSVTCTRAAELRESTITEPNSNRRWTRFAARFKTPRQLVDKVDHIGDTLDVRIALPSREQPSRIYVGLPLQEPSTLPYSIGSKHFKLSADRTDLLEHKRNRWLVDAIGELAVSVAVHRLSAQPRTAWRAIALSDEGCGASPWVRTQFERLVTRQWRELGRRGNLLVDGEPVRLNELIYEVDALGAVLGPADVERLWVARWGEPTRRTVPKAARDGSRWRAVLSDDSCEADYLDFVEAAGVFDWADEEVDSRGAGWLVDLVAAGLALEAGEQLAESRCIPLARGGGRVSPREAIEGGTLLVHTLPKEGLAASLGLAQQIARKLRSKSGNARTVRNWLTEYGALRERATDAAAIRALAGGSGANPRDLQRKAPVLKRLKNSFDQLTPDQRASLGPGVGRNIVIRGFEYEGGRGGRKRVKGVKPSEAYLPSSLDSGPFPKAAGKTPSLQWVDSGYRESLSGPRGKGALAFLRELGAGTAPRLVPAPEPTRNPHAAKLHKRRGLNAQQKTELAELKMTTGLREDWLSPDADAVSDDIRSERRQIQRRARARALILAFEERWDEYADKVEAEAVWHYGQFNVQGVVTATWLARLASKPWLSTREPGLHSAAPRDLAVLTETSFDLEGENRARYSGELESEDADLEVVAALGIRGRPVAADVISQLEDLKEAHSAGKAVDQRLTDRCLVALSRFTSGGGHRTDVGLTDSEIRRALTDPGRRGGLIYLAGKWLSPTDVRLGPPLHDVLPCTDVARDLFRAIGIGEPTASECVTVLRELAKTDAMDRAVEFKVFERLLAIGNESPRSLGSLSKVPLRLHSGWQRSRGANRAFAVSDATLAQHLGQRWPVWDPPMPLPRLEPLLAKLRVTALGPESFEPVVPDHLLKTDLDRRDDYTTALDRLRHYLRLHHAALHDSIPAAKWRELSRSALVISPDWGLRVRTPGRRAQRVPVRAHFFSDPNALCVVDDDQLGRRDGAGQAIAARLGGSGASEASLSLLALVWAESFRDTSTPEFELDPLEEPEESPDLPDFSEFDQSTRKRRPRRRKAAKQTPRPPKEGPRRLHDLNDLDLGKIRGKFLQGSRRGTTIRLSKKAKLVPPKSKGRKTLGPRRSRAGNRDYTDLEREDLGLDLISSVLADHMDLELEDIRDQKNVGADAVDRARNYWVELKAHGKDMPDAVRLEPSEFELAEREKSKFLLAIVWGLEAGREPDYVVISDPIRRLDRRISGRVHLSGVADLVRRAESG